MYKSIPILYTAYGRYISRFRSIPYYIDCLKPVERRLLLVLHQIARDKFIKSARVVGETIGKYHPHGDTSTYQSLVTLVQNNLAIGKGNWGSPGLNDAVPAAQRYTEVKANPIIEKLAFEYIDFVPWEEFELDPEPVYLPSPIPIGLLGVGVISGISFHRTIIPKYNKDDLIKRLKFLIDKKNNLNEPIPIPNQPDCEISGDLKDIFISGIGKVTYSPKKSIDKEIRILGRAPLTTFNRLVVACNEKKLNIISLIDNSKDYINIIVKLKRGIDRDLEIEKIWNNYLIKSINFNVSVCDYDGKVFTIGIDEILLNSYNKWKSAIKEKLIYDLDELNKKKIEEIIIDDIRSAIDAKKIASVNELISNINLSNINIIVYNRENSKFEEKNLIPEIEEVQRICKTRPIQNLIERRNKIEKIDMSIDEVKKKLTNIDEFCLTKLNDY